MLALYLKVHDLIHLINGLIGFRVLCFSLSFDRLRTNGESKGSG
jgi:hypothetical protein